MHIFLAGSVFLPHRLLNSATEELELRYQIDLEIPVPFYASFEAACIGRTIWGGGGVVHTYDLQMGNVRDGTKGGHAYDK